MNNVVALATITGVSVYVIGSNIRDYIMTKNQIKRAMIRDSLISKAEAHGKKHKEAVKMVDSLLKKSRRFVEDRNRSYRHVRIA